jgi:hypothetical protein
MIVFPTEFFDEQTHVPVFPIECLEEMHVPVLSSECSDEQTCASLFCSECSYEKTCASVSHRIF